MKCSDNFLKIYVKDLDVRGKEFSEAITLTGTKIETYEHLDKNLDKIVVGKIESIEKHPNADKLLICKVNVGTEVLQIVTGAQNVYEGMLCPCVLDGGKVAASAHDNLEYPDGIVIKNGKLRGVESYGMLCSIDELGCSKDLYGDIDGIYDMSNLKVEPGDDAITALGLRDVLYDFEITSNRIDCYSVIGIAKEVAATFKKTFTYPKTEFNPTASESKYIDIAIEDNELCPVFATRLVKNVKIAESPEWLKNALRSVGIRPINNIVDITNFVMMEYGQPMHAYDYDTIRGKKMIIKCANDGEKFVTLDGQERILDSKVLTIQDGEGIIGLAGIMGGENSMITDDCTTLLFEAANFNGTNIRLSAKRLGMRTEASNLFEKGLDPNNAMAAMNRACALIEELGAGDICEEFIYDYKDEQKNKNRNVEVKVSKINHLLGTNLMAEEMKAILDKIELNTKIIEDNLIINVPTIRKDINNFADVAEEVIRFYGYDKVGVTIPSISVQKFENNQKDIVDKIAYDVALYNGFNEAMNYSFESKNVYDMLKFSEDAKERKYITILNPLGVDFQVMRTQLVNGILKSLSINYNRKNKEAKLFEIANVYLPLDEKIEVLPDERKTFILAGYGKELDFWTFKGYLNEFLEKCNITNQVYVKEENISYMHPGRTAKVLVNDEVIGMVGEVHTSVLKNYAINDKVYMIVLDMKNVEKNVNFDTKYNEISKFPPSERDLSMTVPKDLTAYDIEKVLAVRGGKLLKKYELFDIYEGEQVEKGYKSMAYNLVFGAQDRTLKDEEIEPIIKKILNGLKDIGVELRK